MKAAKGDKADVVVVYRFEDAPLSNNNPAVKRFLDWLSQENLPNRSEK